MPGRVHTMRKMRVEALAVCIAHQVDAVAHFRHSLVPIAHHITARLSPVASRTGFKGGALRVASDQGTLQACAGPSKRVRFNESAFSRSTDHASCITALQLLEHNRQACTVGKRSWKAAKTGRQAYNEG